MPGTVQNSESSTTFGFCTLYRNQRKPHLWIAGVKVMGIARLDACRQCEALPLLMRGSTKHFHSLIGDVHGVRKA